MEMTESMPHERYKDHFRHKSLKYSILSHCWSQDPDHREVTYQDFVAGANRTGRGWQKIQKYCEISRAGGLDFAWIDTCCIDKTSSAELSEAINSMFTWYLNAEVCYVFLDDVNLQLPFPDFCIDHPDRRGTHCPSCKERWLNGKQLPPLDKTGLWTQDAAHEEVEMVSNFASCRWFSRGWTLQELLAPREVLFYDMDYTLLGSRKQLAPLISYASGIAVDILRQSIFDNYRYISVAQRMSWAAKRHTSREEDEAYCLLGLFDVNMPLLYGEGRKAFARLQEEILRKSHESTLLAWGIDGGLYRRPYEGVLARTPFDFLESGGVRAVPYPGDTMHSFTGRRLEVITDHRSLFMTGKQATEAVLRIGEDVYLHLRRPTFDSTWYRAGLSTQAMPLTWLQSLLALLPRTSSSVAVYLSPQPRR